MPQVENGRFMADLSLLVDEVIVFLIGMRINKPWKVHAWWPVFVAMPKMAQVPRPFAMLVRKSCFLGENHVLGHRPDSLRDRGL